MRADVLSTGDTAPQFTARSPDFLPMDFSNWAGRHVVLSFMGTAGIAGSGALVEALSARRDIFNNDFAALCLVSASPQDEKPSLAQQPGRVLFTDSDLKLAELYGLADGMRASFVLDPLQRVLAVIPMQDPAEHARAVIAFLTDFARQPRIKIPPPVLVLPRLFEPEFCQRLIGLFDEHKSVDLGFMRTDPRTGQSIRISDPAVKRRRDCMIDDPVMREEILARMTRRLFPEIGKVFQFEVGHVERYLVARYQAQGGGFFLAHRDNTTKSTAHRRFAVTVNLNSDYEGGELIFPEFGRDLCRPPVGGAVVFSCSLLHEARPVLRGTRYCFLPFLHDDAAETIRQENQRFLDLPPESLAAS